ncbi:uncharacterized protein [Drosophila takahashii]|uniref:uncharacterized protein n=1 Tax=Drosophila takahashii TaxID=29030 RepID=UPI0038990326
MLQLINERFDEQKEILSSELRESEARVLSNLQKKFQAMATEIHSLTQRVTQLENEVKKVDELQQRVTELASQLAANGPSSGLVDELKQQVVDLDARLVAKCNAEEDAAVASNLRWHGVPQVEGENLKTLFHKLCFSLQLTPPPVVKSIFRVRPRQSGQSFVDPIIIVKLENVRGKVELLRAIGAYRRDKKVQLSLQLIGFESPALMFMNEQLTKYNYEIFKEAMRLKKHKQLTAVFTRRGVVHVKLSEGGEPRYIQSSLELSELTNDVGGAHRNSFRE